MAGRAKTGTSSAGEREPVRRAGETGTGQGESAPPQRWIAIATWTLGRGTWAAVGSVQALDAFDTGLRCALVAGA